MLVQLHLAHRSALNRNNPVCHRCQGLIMCNDIFAIVMLGVALFVGLKVTTPAMIATLNDYLREQSFFDLRLLTTIGFEKDDVEAFVRFPSSNHNQTPPA